MSIQKFLREFKLDIAKAIDASEKTIRATSITVFSNIIQKTPVGNPSLWRNTVVPPGYTGGQLRGNWQTTLDRPAKSSIDRKQNSADGSATSEVVSGTRNYTIDSRIFLTNNLRYAESVNNGSSTQAPKKFVEASTMKFNDILEKIARKNKI